MARQPSPSDQQARYLLRLPDGLREQIEASAKANNRSMNAEIISRLERSFDLDDGLTALTARIDELESAQIDHEKKLEWAEGQIWRLLELTGQHDPNGYD